MDKPENLHPPSAQYREALKFLDSRVDFERFLTIPSLEREFKLDRMRALLERLDNPQNKLPIVHVAGTKGKGSTAAMIASVLTAAGYRTGLFTSPHLNRIEERIAIDGQPCTPDDFAALVERIRIRIKGVRNLLPEQSETDSKKGTGPICSQNRAPTEGWSGRSGKLDLSPFYEHFYDPTYFEILTAMALMHFVRSGVQVAVMEVGLGGRLDSTNVCTPRVSVITSISFDHTQQLGDTLESIAREKGGIIKPGMPVVSGVTDDEPREAIRQIASDCGCRLVELGQDFYFDYHPPQHLEEQPVLGSINFYEKGRSPIFPKSNKLDLSLLFHIKLALLGRHQAANAAVALATINELGLQGWNIPEQAILDGLASVRWPARIEIISRRPVVILDSAHNAASIAALMEVVRESFAVSRRLLLFATTKDKDYLAMLKLLLVEKGDRTLLCDRQKGPVPFFDDIVFTQYTTNPRALPPTELEAAAYELTGRHYPIIPDTAAAWRHIRQSATPDDLVCITGSFFLAGEMRKIY
jgi:dihydrofolate synthase / folylpolyglutamate synthase